MPNGFNMIPDWFSFENQGAGVALADISGGGSRDLVALMVDNPPGQNRGFYRVGKGIATDGTALDGWSALERESGAVPQVTPQRDQRQEPLQAERVEGAKAAAVQDDFDGTEQSDLQPRRRSATDPAPATRHGVPRAAGSRTRSSRRWPSRAPGGDRRGSRPGRSSPCPQPMPGRGRSSAGRPAT